ncbi:hypothetical protein [uncultured Salinisphaera sp.]|uniref:hypothetical protein n=1 Tax=uncultured Salinisphaera sp. TaxID=359372 RepID=UPI0032B1D90A|tara:strand:- start:43 stop:267 length:225 start_codon:yes stop_codon:yes gene_type:complete
MSHVAIRSLSIAVATIAAVACLIHALLATAAPTVMRDFAVAVSLFAVATYHAACLYDRWLATLRPQRPRSDRPR